MNSPNYVQSIVRWFLQHGLSILIILAGTVLAWMAVTALNRRLFGRLFRGKEEADAQQLARTMESAVRWVLRLVIIAIAVVLLLNACDVNVHALLAAGGIWLMSRGLGIALIVALAVVGMKVSGYFSSRMVSLVQRGKRDEETQKRATTLSSVIRWSFKVVILILAMVMILGELGVNIGPVIAAAGVVGLAVGFGAQSLVADVISGFFILLEDQVRVGDVVQLDGRGGLVERITLRMTILRDFSGSVHYVRNGKIDVITNMTKDYSHYVFDIGVAYREDVDEVSDVIKGVGEEMQNDPAYKDDILEPVEVAGLDKFGDSAVVIKARIKTKPIRQWRVGREFNRRLKKKFDELGIEIPFPHITLYPGKDKKNDSPTLKIEMAGGPEAEPRTKA